MKSYFVCILFIASLFACEVDNNPSDPGKPFSTEKLVIAAYQPYWGHNREWHNWEYYSVPHPERNCSPGVILNNNRRNIASSFYPLIGVYDSTDPVVISFHIELAKAIGIDVFQVDYYADLDPFMRLCFENVLRKAEKLDFHVSVLYEPKIHLQNWIPHSGRQEQLNAIIDDIEKILTRYEDSPAFLHHNGKPVISIFGMKWEGMTIAEWNYIFSEIKKKGHSPIFIGDNAWQSTGYNNFNGLFHWELYKDEIANGNNTDIYNFCSLINSLSIEWADSFGDSRLAVGIISPGFNDSKVWGWGLDYQRIISLTGPVFYKQSIAAFLNNKEKLDWLLIATFNDWNEGSMIEPNADETEPYALAKLTQECIESFKGIELNEEEIHNIISKYLGQFEYK